MSEILNIPHNVSQLSSHGTGAFRHARLPLYADADDRVAAAASGMEPSAADAHTLAAWAIVYDANGPRAEEALSHARPACELNPNSADSLVCLGQLQGFNGQWNTRNMGNPEGVDSAQVKKGVNQWL